VKLIHNAGDWWRFWSIRFIAISGVLVATIVAIQAMPETFQAYVPAWFKQMLAIGSSFGTLLAGLSRVVQQTPAPTPAAPVIVPPDPLPVVEEKAPE